ncbi:hypothetical protein Acor_52720 [Acrocarpospora corrugata]|uniref:NB-ARC domain-containing protein n=1 Tax=Acrocarpospora corrugata TaxID=35763 RepID=A0A5M3W396_9ACTN|nr:hypothetical protein [Acrocarpospora corrugata]GES03206.1 hypothetical protein Acor_52720 [Acrocarpospora corrugata]
MDHTAWPQGNIPAETSSFVGRAEELGRVDRLLGQARLVTVVGGAGVGKTRIALKAAAGRGEDYPDGVWFVELSTERDGNLLPGVVAQGLGLREQSVRPYRELLAEFLAPRRLLLVLDTCEHLIRECADLAGELLAAAPGLTVLATSRSPLGLAGERQCAIQPFALPPPESDDPLGYDAVRLFVERAHDRVPGWIADPAALMAVSRLCRRVDGVPLGIELAAGHLHALSAEQIADHLATRFDLLTAGYRGGPPRHQTFRSAVGWSHELCAPAERLLWARLSVFAGHFDEPTVAAVCADSRLPDTAPVLAELVRRSIVIRSRGRYRLLDSIREYGRDWLRELGEEDLLRRAHRDHYLTMIGQMEADWYGPRQAHWADWADAELPELRIALEYSLHDPGEALGLAAGCWFIWGCLGQMREGRYYVERALAAAPGSGPRQVKARWVLSWITIFQGDMGVATEAAEQALDQARALGDEEAIAHALIRIGGIHLFSGRPELVEEVMARARRHLVASGARTMDELVMDSGRAMAFVFLGDLDRAWAVLRHIRERTDACGETWLRSFADLMRSQVMLARGDVDGADQAGRDSLAVKWPLRDALGIAMCVDHLASVAAARGDGHRTAWLHGAGERLWATFGLTAMGSEEMAAPRRASAAAARGALGDEGYGRAFEIGFAASLEEVRSYVLDG